MPQQPKSKDPGLAPVQSPSDLLFYQTEDGQTRLDVRLQGETVWLTQLQMAELFQRDKSVISKHIKNAFDERELVPGSVVANFATTAADGKSYQTAHYNLDVIISVGYRVKSHRGTQFRIWATQRLREYIVKGFTLDDQRLKEGPGNYFDELLGRIREIRASERISTKKSGTFTRRASITTRTPRSPRISLRWRRNKIHWAIHGHTAAELIAARADAGKPNMGLTSWSGRKPGKHDVHIAKNYLNKEEMELLNLIVSQYLDFAEFQARTRKVMYMRDWAKKLDDFLRLNDREVLQGLGKVSAQLAREKAEREFTKYERQQRLVDDQDAADAFAQEIAELQRKARTAHNGRL
jgi:hypothetical protein